MSTKLKNPLALLAATIAALLQVPPSVAAQEETSEVDTLKRQVESDNAMIQDLTAQINALKTNEMTADERAALDHIVAISVAAQPIPFDHPASDAVEALADAGASNGALPSPGTLASIPVPDTTASVLTVQPVALVSSSDSAPAPVNADKSDTDPAPASLPTAANTASGRVGPTGGPGPVGQSDTGLTGVPAPAPVVAADPAPVPAADPAPAAPDAAPAS